MPYKRQLLKYHPLSPRIYVSLANASPKLRHADVDRITVGDWGRKSAEVCCSLLSGTYQEGTLGDLMKTLRLKCAPNFLVRSRILDFANKANIGGRSDIRVKRRQYG